MGKAFGYKATDYVTLDDTQYTIKQTFLQLTQLSLPKGLYFNADGILGLGLTNPLSPPNIVHNLYDQDLISHKCFSIYLSNDPSSLDTQTGDLMIGGYNPKYIKDNQPFTFLKVKSMKGHWQTSLYSMQIGEVNLIGVEKVLNAIFDTGSSIIYVPYSIMRQITNQFTDVSGCQISKELLITCRCDIDLPVIGFQFSDYHASLEKEYYLAKKKKGYCEMLIAPSNQNEWIVLGDTFLRKFYTFYSYKNSTVGIVEAVHIAPSHPLMYYSILVGIIISIIMFLVVIWNFKKQISSRFRNKNKTGSLEKLLDQEEIGVKQLQGSNEVEFSIRNSEKMSDEVVSEL